MTKPQPCAIRALMKSHDARAIAARCIRAEGALTIARDALRAEIEAREGAEAEVRALREHIATTAAKGAAV